ncbi:hypothetical protein AN958_01667 [Leucoagaricus sp. SymC.cos]|nr:hypothetical protein AN958_01667 [Leucoagaricus sp. SymC.cos]
MCYFMFSSTSHTPVHAQPYDLLEALMAKRDEHDKFTRLFNPKNVTVNIYHGGIPLYHTEHQECGVNTLGPVPSSDIDESLLDVMRDKSTVQEICRELENLNASITFCVLQILDNSQVMFYETVVEDSQVRDLKRDPTVKTQHGGPSLQPKPQIVPVADIIRHHHDRVAKDPGYRRALLQTLLQDAIIGFIYHWLDVAPTNPNPCRVDRMAKQITQWWRSISYQMLPIPTEPVYTEAAPSLLLKLNNLLSTVFTLDKWDYISFKEPPPSTRFFNPLPLLSDLLQSFYLLLRKMRTQIVSEELEFRELLRYWDEINIDGNSTSTSNSVSERSLNDVSFVRGIIYHWELHAKWGLDGWKLVVLGVSGLGLVGVEEDGTRKIYVRSSVVPGCFDGLEKLGFCRKIWLLD